MAKKSMHIAVVVGNVSRPRLLGIYDALLQYGSVDIHVIDDERTVSEAKTSCRLIVYPHLPDMPGYLRNLEDQLVGANLIVAAETSSLAAFQAIRIARKENIPSLVICDEYRPLFYAGYPNIRAIQADVLQHATAFATTSQLAQAALQLEGVPDDRIKGCAHPVDVRRFCASSAARKKFRAYVGLGDEDFVITVHEHLRASTRVMEIMQALRLCGTIRPTLAQNIRVLFVGDGDLAKDLKYAAYDHGLARQILFMHQNCEPFLHDLYAASDAIVHLKHSAPDAHEVFPLHVLEAAATGAMPIVSAHTVAGELLTGHAEVLLDDNFQALAVKICDLAQHNRLNKERGEALAKHIAVRFSENTVNRLLADVVAPILVMGDSPQQVSFGDEVAKFEEMIRDGHAVGSIVALEEAMLRHKQPGLRSQLMRLKGDALTRCGRAEDALQAYTESLQIDDANYASYRALGYLSLQSHAHEEAVAFFKKALSGNPEDAHSLVGVGMVYRRLGLPDESLHWFETAVQKAGDQSRVVAGFVQVCMECSDAKRALTAVDRAIDTRGDLTSLLVAKGQLLIKLGRSAEGNELLQKSLNSSVA